MRLSTYRPSVRGGPIGSVGWTTRRPAADTCGAVCDAPQKVEAIQTQPKFKALVQAPLCAPSDRRHRRSHLRSALQWPQRLRGDLIKAKLQALYPIEPPTKTPPKSTKINTGSIKWTKPPSSSEAKSCEIQRAAMLADVKRRADAIKKELEDCTDRYPHSSGNPNDLFMSQSFCDPIRVRLEAIKSTATSTAAWCTDTKP